MFSNYLSSIEGVSIYPIISFTIFFLFFIGLIVWTLKVDKKYLSKMEQLPLDNIDNKKFVSDKDENQ